MIFTLLYTLGFGILANCGYLTYKFFTDDVNSDNYFTAAKIQLMLISAVLLILIGVII